MYISQNMSLTLNSKVCINTLPLKPGIIIWYARIPEITQSVCCKNTYHSFRPMVNEIFNKNDFLPAFLKTQEIKTLNNFRALKKQIEWLCGRYLLKDRLQYLFNTKEVRLNRKSERIPRSLLRG